MRGTARHGEVIPTLAACSKTSCLPREGTRPTGFPRKSAYIVGPVRSPGGFFNGLLLL